MNKFAIQDNSNYTSGMKEEYVQTILAKVANGTMLSQDAQKALGMTKSTFHRLKNAQGVKRPDGVRKKMAAAAKATRESRAKTANLVIEGRITFEEGLAITNIHRISLWRIINRIKASA